MKVQTDLRSRLPKGGVNLFQGIKAKKAEAEARGILVVNLSIGQPKGPALMTARVAASQAVMSGDESMHEYQDNGSPGVSDFALKFVMKQVETAFVSKTIDFVPTPGTKPMLGLIPQACGAIDGKKITVATTTSPGYPTPKDQCLYQGIEHYALPTNSANKFLFSPKDIRPGTDLLMINYPHNPSGQVASQKWLREVCRYCAENGIRIFNDAAYIGLSHTKDSCALIEVAQEFNNLSYSEAFSASKIGNFTGWRIGAIAGSWDFIQDIKTIKGNTDSGFAAFAAAGILNALQIERGTIQHLRESYANRLKLLIEILTGHEMRLAVEPKAGFFALFEVPKMAFGLSIRDAEEFNLLMIEKTGIVGVHFHPYIRYAVVENIDNMNTIKAIASGFKMANVSY
ncbi:MAG: Aminotransferase, I and II [candidate division CPR2 bacterium GW2011_GWC2_39_10]|uniref:Aminotransferase n=1 Tax=candidate division CPR2 bacterium GW2011_GWC2_39_10 TaxID=1618345 RepID=A0A0G0LQY4_UNCC2|nr:MAG: Aminotransferase, I and II [candidate division CPR2 bacterium GW2011_GWC2_39_10]